MPSNLIKLARGNKGGLIGQNGSGKSYLAKHSLLPFTGQLLIIDPKGTFNFDNLEAYDTVREIERRRPKRCIYRPNRFELRDKDARDAIYNYVYERQEIFCYTDELLAMVSGSTPPPSFQDCYALGRELGITMLTACQRPSRVPLLTWTECQKMYVFRLTWKGDRDRMREAIGDGYTGLPPTQRQLSEFAAATGVYPDPRFVFTYADLERGTLPRFSYVLPERK